MNIEVIDNVSTKLVEKLLLAMSKSNDFRVAAAFVSAKGLSLLRSELQNCAKRDCYVEFVLGVDLTATDPQALWILYQLSKSNQNVKLYCYNSSSSDGIYHPKLYVANQSFVVTAIVGSSNLTEGGLRSNVEVNILIESEPDSDIISDIYAVYNRVKFSNKCFEPDDEFLRLYHEICSVRKKQETILSRKVHFRKLNLKIAEKISSLRYLSPTSKDLFGWQKLVFERLPAGLFKTRDLYKFEAEFRCYYPQNRHIRAKIRQVLQQLRDLGIIKHVGKETWMKKETEQDQR